MKGLIVEDDRKLATFLSRVLAEEGYTVDLCSTGTEAIGQIRVGSHDFVVLDWMLPDVDGLTVCREVRNSGTITPIIMLTARGEVSERVLGLRAGADDYLGKPQSRDFTRRQRIRTTVAASRALSRRRQ